MTLIRNSESWQVARALIARFGFVEAHLARAYTEAELRDMAQEVAEYGEVRP